VDVVALQRHFLNLGIPFSGCRLTAADVNRSGMVDTVDVIAVQRFFLGLISGVADVGMYQFVPAMRNYLDLATNKSGENYGALVFGDVTSPFTE